VFLSSRFLCCRAEGGLSKWSNCNDMGSARCDYFNLTCFNFVHQLLSTYRNLLERIVGVLSDSCRQLALYLKCVH
jgi:hypothetical protein